MDSVEFCGQACHSVMKPEYVAYQAGPHARVACVRCHTAPGAGGFVEAKASGTRRVVALFTGSVARPIRAPLDDLRPARETCERCHWPEQSYADVLKRVSEFADDEANTETVTTLQVHVGGGDGRDAAGGIHERHTNLASPIEYIATDDQRQVIPWVKVTDRSGGAREYVVAGVTPEALAAGNRRTMDCLDCHNRPAHTMAASAERAVDRVIARGAIPRTLPFVRREAVKALKGSHPTETAALDAIATALRRFYETEHGEVFAARREDVERAVRAAQGVYQQNVFPEMNVEFGTYPNNIGHVDAPGCFRCHDDSHVAADGGTIGQDCGSCHRFE
jgi:cytochrome c556